MGGQKINSRLTFTIVVQLVILVGIGLIAYMGINRVGNALVDVSHTVETQADMSQLGEILRNDLLSVVNSVARGTSNWEQGSAALPVAKAKFDETWKGLLGILSASEKERLQNIYKSSLAGINETFAELEKLLAGRDRARLNLFVNNDLEVLVNPFFKTLLSSTTEIKMRAEQNLKAAQDTSNTFTVVIAVIGLIGIAASFGLGSATYRAITTPLNQIMG